MVLIKLYETLLQENQWRGTNIVLQTKSSEGLTFIYRFLPSPKEKEGGGSEDFAGITWFSGGYGWEINRR